MADDQKPAGESGDDEDVRADASGERVATCAPLRKSSNDIKAWSPERWARMLGSNSDVEDIAQAGPLSASGKRGPICSARKIHHLVVKNYA